MVSKIENFRAIPSLPVLDNAMLGGWRSAEGAAKPTAVLEAIRALDRAVSKGVVHRNTAARKKSALARRLVAAK